MDAGDFKGAKTAFIPSFIQEIREKTGPEVSQLVEELDMLLCERQGWVLLGVFRTGGTKEAFPDGLIRLQPGGVGNRVAYVLFGVGRRFFKHGPFCVASIAQARL